ncbi:MAG: 7-cyano-7-deazaguanine synthase [Ignavibacteria bacterium]|nr:7-cyano-7-deazaguanine synthase [Ignavibacteria bacterium]
MSSFAIVLVSGGLDSALAAAIAAERYELAFLHVNYGQRTESRELKAFKDIAKYYGVKKKLIVDISYLKDIGGSALTDERIEVGRNFILPEFSSNRLRQDSPNGGKFALPLNPPPKGDFIGKGSEVPMTYVPFRNANILAIAVSWAEVIGARKIYIGAVEEDSSGYPDCRKVFFDAYNKMIATGIKPETRIKIETPLINLSKKQIVQKSIKLKSPMHLTWSCYSESKLACGVCESCALRLRGFRLAGVKDPIRYVRGEKFMIRY